VVPVDGVELPDWPVDGQSVAGDVVGQGPVGAVDAVLVRAVVRDDREVGGRSSGSTRPVAWKGVFVGR